MYMGLKARWRSSNALVNRSESAVFLALTEVTLNAYISSLCLNFNIKRNFPSIRGSPSSIRVDLTRTGDPVQFLSSVPS